MLHSFSMVTGSLNVIWSSLHSHLPLVISISIMTSSQFPKLKSLVIFKFFLLCFPCPFSHHILFLSYPFLHALLSWNMATNFLVVLWLCAYSDTYGTLMPRSSQNSVLISFYHLRITVVQTQESGCLSSDPTTWDFRQVT